MESVEFPQLQEWLTGPTTPSIPYTKTLSQAWNDPFALVHSSGTTGAPKLIRLSQGTIAAAAYRKQSPEEYSTIFDLWTGLRVLLAVPLSIAAGIFCMLPLNIHYGWIVVLPPPIPITAELLDGVHRHANVQVSAALPKVYPDLVKHAQYLHNLSTLRYVAYSGAPYPLEAGTAMASRVHLVSLLGSSETGPIPTELTDAEDWEYTKFAKSLPHRLDHVCDDLHELVLTRGLESTCSYDENSNECSALGRRSSQPVFCTFPDLVEYRTKDLYSKHNSKADLWRFRGRKDDLITLSSVSPHELRRMFPKVLEDAVNAHPAIKAGVVVGNDKPRPALLVEPQETCSAEERQDYTQRLVDDVIWPILMKVNPDYPEFCHITRSMIFFTAPGRPIPRTTVSI
ncbi:MAG: hypothetical protein L6R37_002250 [Teloschistes peruensis]|nr:MAG: hypothetical protein L6R37_002250 [Teloschistes peruensis]